MKATFLVIALATFSFIISGCSGNVVDSEELMKADKIIYRFKDSSVPPQYHRSYVIEIKKPVAKITVDSYGDILNTSEEKITDEQFAQILQTIESSKIAITSDTSDDGGCSGGTSEYLEILNNENVIFDGNIYHCGKEDFGNMSGDTKALSTKLKDLFPDFQKLLKR